MARVAVTDDVYPKAADIFQSWTGLECICAPTEERALAEAIRASRARHAIVGTFRYVGELYRALTRGSVIARFGVGYDGIDKPQATAAGILCTNTPHTLDDSVAEHTVALLLAVARKLIDLAGGMRRGEWTIQLGMELRKKRLAVIGCGPIGCRVARIAALGLGMSVVGCVRNLEKVQRLREELGFAELTDNFADAVRDVDFVSLHLPATFENHHFVNRSRLALMPQRVWLINTARGAVVNERDLFDALLAHKIGGAALDVFEEEPYVPVAPEKDLRTLPNVLLTPHAASSTVEACGRMATRALENIVAAEAGKYSEMDLLNPDVLRSVPAR